MNLFLDNKIISRDAAEIYSVVCNPSSSQLFQRCLSDHNEPIANYTTGDSCHLVLG